MMLKLPVELKYKDIVLDINRPMNSSPVAPNSIRTWSVVGQERAVKALEMGMAINAKGYNILVVGESGIGKYTAILDILNHNNRKKGNLRDIVYVQDFSEPDKPRSLILPEGTAGKLKKDIILLIKRIQNRITHDLDSETYKTEKVALIHGVERKENEILAEFESQLNAEGFRMIQTEDVQEGLSMDIAPVIDGKTVRFEELQNQVPSGFVSKETWKETRERYFALMNNMNSIHRDLKMARESLEKKLKELRTGTIQPGIREECTAILEQWKSEDVRNHLEAIATDVIENAHWFIGEENEEGTEEIDLEVHYGVNIVLDRYGVDRRPVIHETNPTRLNLFGSIEARYDVSGEIRTNMMMIKAGSLLKADGGFLILQAEDIFSRENLWPELKKAFQTRHVVPEAQSTPLGPLPILMKPEPIITETTVILIGSERIYQSISEIDNDFFKLFKITAEFSADMPRQAETENEYAAFINGFVSKENLKPVNPDGIREIIAYGIQLAERRNKLSAQFSLIGDLIRESNYVATQENKSCIDREMIQKAIDYREYMNNLPEQVLMEQIENGMIILSVEGMRIGTVNGLAVLERGAYSFGIPLRVTAAVSPGKDGLINIERESGLSGELHDKGVFLMEGYIRQRYAHRHNISLTASLAVEQSYYEIDGDSASAAELATLLSAIANLPIRQDVAVTGAVNQLGEIQPVGSIQKKIQGFFKVCRARGLTGQQGVIIPAGNVNNVILSDRVITAIKAGAFHIWTARNMDDVMTLLADMNAGKEWKKGHFESNSINYKVRKGLMKLTALSRLSG